MSFPELDQLLRLVSQLERVAEGRAPLHVEVLRHVSHRGRRLPIIGLVLGPEDPSTPVFALVGGVHGIERIGAEVVLAYLETIAASLAWDVTLQRELEHVRLAFLPIVNPVGMWRGTRSNGRGVDLMRNAPTPSGSLPVTPFVGGQAIGPLLPWFRGGEAGEMEPESRALCDFVHRHVMPARVAISVDCHSGYGRVDRLWFPYAHTRDPYPSLPETAGLAQLLDESSPNHIYRIEPQAQSYTIAGDLWDHLYMEHATRREEGALMIPLTLEMGSWSWVRKNPRQLLRRDGGFHPVVPHRIQRTLRRHLMLFDFLRRAVASAEAWVPSTAASRDAFRCEGYLRWYG